MQSIEVVPCVCGRKTSELQCLPLEHIVVAFVEDNVTRVQYRILKILSYIKGFCAKPKEVDPINFNFCMTDMCFDSTQT